MNPKELAEGAEKKFAKRAKVEELVLEGLTNSENVLIKSAPGMGKIN